VWGILGKNQRAFSLPSGFSKWEKLAHRGRKEETGNLGIKLKIIKSSRKNKGKPFSSGCS